MQRGAIPLSTISRRRVLVGGAALTVAGALLGCEDAQAPVDEEGRVRIRFATDARAQAGHGGFYQALASGAYARRNLNVEIVQGRPGTDVPQLLASGAVELGLASDSFTPLNLVAEGAPVKAVAGFFQKNVSVLIAHPDPEVEVTGLADLNERPVLLADAARDRAWVWLKAEHGFSDGLIQPDDATPDAFLADDQAVMVGSVTDDPYAIEQAGEIEPRVFLLADAGYASYGALVLSPDGFARDNAVALRAFIAASAEGWRDYIRSDASDADALIRRANPDMTQVLLDQARARLNAFGIVDGGDAALFGLGTMTTERWQAFFETMSQGGIYPPGLNWREAFTDDYLPGRG